MGITIQQYRAVIGCWNVGRMRRILPSPAPVELSTRSHYQDNQDAGFLLKGPWKLHAAVLTLLLTPLLIHLLAPYSPATGSLPGLTSSNHTAILSNRQSDMMDTDACSIAPQCLKALLLIGGVEPNPGPGITRDEKIQAQTDIIAELCTNAPNTTVRDTLRLYDPKLDHSSLVKSINRANKGNLVACLSYLGQGDMSDYTKEACVNALICRVQNLFPDQCSFCEEQYCNKPTDSPLLACKICGQGVHTPCILDHLQLQPDEQQTLTAAEIWSRINPTSLPGLHYLCAECEKSTIPSEEAGKRKKKPKPSTREDDKDTPPAVPSVEDMSLLVASQLTGHDDTLFSTQEGSQQDSSVDRTETTETATHNPEAPTTLPATGNICSFYRKGTCRYGVSGRGCPKEHPKPCRKLLQHGTKAPHGCALGRDKCNKFHPKMCPSSIRKGECYSTSCRLKHVVGTKRTLSNQDGGTPTEAVNSQTNKTEASSDFLEALRLLKAEMLEAMDLKLAMIISSQTSAVQNQMTQASTAPSNMAPVQPATAPVSWINHTPPVMPSMLYGSQGGQPSQQPYGLVRGPHPHAPVMYAPASMGHVQGAQQPVYLAAAPMAPSH